MASIILHNPSLGISHLPTDSWLWSWDPFRALNAWMSAEPRAANDASATEEAAFAPRFDVKEDKGEYVLSADLPGVKSEAVEISLDGDRLRVSGHREAVHKVETQRTFLSECSYGSFSRQFTLPEGVDAERVSASLKDGVLTLVLPKKPEAQPRKIAVNASETKA
jgi:HSP20 family protein